MSEGVNQLTLNAFSSGDTNAGTASTKLSFIHLTWDEFPYTATRYIATADTLQLSALLPDDCRTIRSHQSYSDEILLARTDLTAYLLEWTKNGGLTINVAAKDATADKLSKEVGELVPVTELDDSVVKVWTWYSTLNGFECTGKTIKAQRWVEVEGNYTSKTGAALAEIMKMHKPDCLGKILLWHGAPGTGKTTAIRTLMREWKSWCQCHYVADPEQLFLDPAYLLRVGAPDSGSWRAVIVEDTDEFVRVRGHKDAHGSMGRLLNFADGILGQGCNTLFVLTTNEDVDKIHPALVRPGRCAAQVQFHKFDEREAADWLPVGARLPLGDKTLAELMEYSCESNKQISTGIADRPIGTYL